MNNGEVNLNDMIGRVLQNPEALGNIMKLAQNFMNNSGQQSQQPQQPQQPQQSQQFQQQPSQNPPFGVQTPNNTQQGNMQQGGTQQGNMQQGGNQQGNMQQGGTQQGNMQQGGNQQGNMQQGNMPSPEQLRQFLTQMQGINQGGGGGSPNMSNPGPQGGDENRVRLLNALRPYLGDARRQTVDYIIGILKLLELAGASGLFNSFGAGMGTNMMPRESMEEEVEGEEYRTEAESGDGQ